MLLKLDFAKAYDMLDWDFLFEVFTARGFGHRIQWDAHVSRRSKASYFGQWQSW